jgi:uncharacterized protein (DUF1684 family)
MTTTYETHDLVSAWTSWHAAREADLITEHGWLSLTGFHWLPSARAAFDALPGKWHVSDDQAVLDVNGAAGLTLASGPRSGAPVDGREQATVAEAGSLLWVRTGDDVLVELVLRGGRYAVRVRDPRAPERAAFAGVPAFDIDPSWVKPGRYSAFPTSRRIEVDTARSDLRQHITAVGTVEVAFNGRPHPLIATAGPGGRLAVSFRDETNGRGTAPWRVVTTSVPTETGALVVDFNRAVNLPFAFTEFGTCPAPVPANQLPVAVTAGELAPVRVTGPSALLAANGPVR